MRNRVVLLAFGTLAIGCSGGDDTPCDPVAQSGCDGGQVCEQVSGGDPACFAPVEVHGRVLDLADTAGVGDARIVAVDVNGAAATGVSVSAVDGTYVLGVPAVRAADGTPAAFPVSLRADADGYQTFPGGLRQALPLDIAAAVRDGDGPWVLQSTLTDIGLIALAAPQPGSIIGHVAIPDDHAGILVVAEAGASGYAAIADRDGDYAIFNLPSGSYTVTAYAKGHVYTPADAQVATAAVEVDLSLSDASASAMSGSVSIVNAPGGSMTSVVVFVESTFDPDTEHGVGPAGVRAPATGAPNVTGAFTIDGVPPGRYVVLAAYENDNLVRDPDQCQAGTDILHVVVEAGTPLAITSSFKVTEALPITGPGATDAEAVTAAPMLQFTNDSSAVDYEVDVFNAFGEPVWSTTVADNQAPLAVPYAGPLDPGMYYQFRATSYRMNGPSNRCAISTTEQLRGVFFAQ